MLRATKKTLYELAYAAEFVIQKFDKGFSLRHIPTYSAVLYSGKTRLCVFYLQGYLWAKENKKAPDRQQMFDAKGKNFTFAREKVELEGGVGRTLSLLPLERLNF